MERAFLGAAEDGYDAPEGGGFLQEGEEVHYQADAGVIRYCCGVVEGFGGFLEDVRRETVGSGCG